ncbi:MAG TPA: TonB-dependent receptor, partial [Gillisia sp.]|nr:TonB-dependent receptor [Gillisia sp.]
SGVSGYSRFNNRVAEFNYDLILNFNTDIAEGLNLDGNIGANLRRNHRSFLSAATNGGLNAPGVYALSNSADPLNPPQEYDGTSSVDGVYARAGIGYLGTYYLEGTVRRDRSSTLPISDNVFVYPSISTSVILSNVFEADWMNFMKFRANYAVVGGDTDRYRVFNTYTVSAPFAGAGVAANNATLNNQLLKPETSFSYEIGLEGDFFDRRIGFDVSYYNTQTEDQITPIPVSTATGFSQKILNAGTVENKGVEVLLRLNPIRSEDFNWNITANWAQNRSKVLELADGINNLQLAALQGGISINAAPGQPYGAIRGRDYVYDDNGNRLVNASGFYLRSATSNEIIGNIQPDWTGGVSNSLQYKNVSLSFLVDVQKGGDIFSLDTWYGFATGLYDRSVGNNDLGNPVRNPVSQGGGVILPGVTADGQPNTTRVDAGYYGTPFGYARDANKGHVYDASFVKLREASLSYVFSENLLGNLPITNASVSLVGRNLWIIHKNLPYSDPEAGLSSGNIQGYQSGAYPAFREIGASVKFNF